MLTVYLNNQLKNKSSDIFNWQIAQNVLFCVGGGYDKQHLFIIKKLGKPSYKSH